MVIIIFNLFVVNEMVNNAYTFWRSKNQDIKNLRFLYIYNDFAYL